MTTPRRRFLRLPALAAGLLLSFGAQAASGQAHLGHPAPAQPRPLHERLAEADAAAVATVREVGEGRIGFADARSVVGRVPESFEVKRSPGNPPPLAAGDRVLLLLRGARAPYVLVDRPLETIRLADDTMEERWSTAVRAVADARSEPGRLAPLYLEWISRGPATLSEIAVQGLLDPEARFQPLDTAFFDEVVRRAFDPALPLEARRSFAVLCVASPTATTRLLAGVPRKDDPAEPGLSETALQAGLLHRSPGLGDALRRALAHEDAAVRLVALGIAGLPAEPPAPDLRRRVEELTRSDPDSAVRERARQVLETPPTRPRVAE